MADVQPPRGRPQPSAPRRALTALLLAFAAAVVSFVASTVCTQLESSRIDAQAISIARNAAPSLERLAVLRGDVRVLEVEVLLGGTSPERAERRAWIAERRAALDRELRAYFALPSYAAEQAIWTEPAARQELQALDRAIDLALARMEAGDTQAAAVAMVHMHAVADRAADALARLIEVNAREASDRALAIQGLRERAMRTAYALDTVSVVLTVLAGGYALRLTRRYARLAEEHRRLVEARAVELEQFAGRVAHDVLSPLQAVQMSIRIGQQRSADDVVKRSLDRGEAGLRRVMGIVHALLDFARAGAKPDPEARADARAVLDELLGELRPAAEQARVELSLDAPSAAPVACSAAMLTVMITNLVRNAIKYIGDGPQRRVAVRVRDRGARMRFEVEDTGPGLSQGLEDGVFQPYVRGRGHKQSGIGLGLATVKRLVDAHGGAIGVRSLPGAGCLFWFDLPRAPEAPSEHPASA